MRSLFLLLPLALFLAFLPPPAYTQGLVTLSAGYGAGLPTTTNNPVPIGMENLSGDVRGISLEICDENNFLTPSTPISCQTTDRSAGFSCSTSELSGGCLRLLLFDLGGGAIEAGEGPVATVYYNVSSQAQLFLGQCVDLTLQNVQMSDADGNPIPSGDISLEPGQFCIQSPPSCLTVTPGSGMQGAQNLSVVITAENTSFVQGLTQVSFSNPGITVTSTTVNSPTRVTVTVDIASGAAVGLTNVTVTTDPEQITCLNAFEVMGQIISCLSVMPGNGRQGATNLAVAITGQFTNFSQGVTQVSFENPGITVTGTTVISSNQLTVIINIGSSALVGLGDVTVTTGPEVITCANAFEVREKVISCLGVSPGFGMQGAENLRVVITGQYTSFIEGVTQVSFENPGITVVDTAVDSATQVTVWLDIVWDAIPIRGDVTVATGSEIITCSDAFEVVEKTFEISDIRVSNPTSASFTVSWITDGNSNGIVNYSPSPDLSGAASAYDDRGNFHLDDTHHVSIGSLEPETTYYYEIISGGTIDNNNGLYYSFTTVQVPAEPPPTCPVYGWVFLEDGTIAAEGTIAYLKVVNGTGESYWISVPTDFMGVWVLNLGNLYNTITDDAMTYNAGDALLLELRGGDGRVYNGEFVVPAVCPLFTGLITLTHYIQIAGQLNTGFNLIAFPFDPITDANFNAIAPTACSLINDIPCEQAFSWNPDTQSWLSAFDDGVNCIGDDFPIEPGKGYFIKVTTDTEATFYGKEIAYPLPLAFEPGLNLVSVPYSPDSYTACSLMAAIPTANKSFSWDADLQRWLSALVIPEGGCIGNDFSVIREKGYFMYTDSRVARWVPGTVGECSADEDCDDGNACTDDVCDGAGLCTHPDNADPCDDGLYCTVGDACLSGICGGTARDCSGSADQCNDGICDEGLDQCVGQPVADGTGCDDGLYCTQVDQCLGGQCIGSDDPCADNGLYCDGVEYCTEDTGGYLCGSSGDPCAPLTCDEANDICTGGEVTLSIPDTYGYAGTIAVELDNPVDSVSEVHLNVCDVDLRPWFAIDTAGCATTVRSADFSCVITGLGGGCVQVDLTTAVAGLIGPGTGAIAQLNYTIAADAPPGDFADLTPVSTGVLDDTAASLAVTPLPGRVRAVE